MKFPTRSGNFGIVGFFAPFATAPNSSENSSTVAVTLSLTPCHCHPCQLCHRHHSQPSLTHSLSFGQSVTSSLSSHHCRRCHSLSLSVTLCHHCYCPHFHRCRKIIHCHLHCQTITHSLSSSPLSSLALSL